MHGDGGGGGGIRLSESNQAMHAAPRADGGLRSALYGRRVVSTSEFQSVLVRYTHDTYRHTPHGHALIRIGRSPIASASRTPLRLRSPGAAAGKGDRHTYIRITVSDPISIRSCLQCICTSLR